MTPPLEVHYRWPCLLLSLSLLIAFASTSQGGSVIGAANDLVKSNDFLNIDESTGAGSSIGSPSGIDGAGLAYTPKIAGLAYDPGTNTLYGADTVKDSLVTIDISTAVATVVKDPFGLANVESLAFDQNTGTLYGFDFGSDELITIDPSTGVGTIVGELLDKFQKTVTGLAFDSNNSVLYAVESDDSDLLTINTANGNETVIVDLSGTSIISLAYDNATDTLYGSSTNTLYRINPTTAVVTSVGAIGFSDVEGLTAVPEASAFLYLSLVSAGYFWARKRMTGTDE